MLTVLHWVPVLLVFAFLAFDGTRAIVIAGALVASAVLLIGPTPGSASAEAGSR